MTYRILIVEDSSLNGNLLTMLLEDNGYESEWVTTAEACLSLTDEQQFDLILMDISLPGMDGKEATRCLRKKSQYKDTPIIACTVYGLQEAEKDILAAGINGIVQKPFDEELLTRELSQWLNTKA